MKRPSLHWLMLIPTLVAITIGFAAFAIYIDNVEQSNRIADIDSELIRAERTTADVGRPGAPPPGRGQEPPPDGPPEGPPFAETTEDPPVEEAVDEEAVDAPIQLLVSSTGQVLNQGTGGNPFPADVLSTIVTQPGTRTVDEPRYRVRVAPSADGAFAITALSLDQADAANRSFRRTLLGGGLLILLLEGLVVWFLTKALVRPVTEMAAAATRVASGELDSKIDPPRGSRETATLAIDLERMVSQLRATIDDRESAAAEANQARDAMQRFLADASHELRTPLTALKGYSDLYAGNMLDEPGALDRAMGRIGNESDRLAHMVNDMLQLARQVPTEPNHRPVHVAHIAEAVVDDLRAAHPDNKIDLRLHNAANVVVIAEPGQIHQALLNLGSNACTYTDPVTVVTLALRSTATDLIIEVMDHGPGIDPSEADKIFLPFYRPDSSRSRHGQGGAGLGLALVKQIADQHDGHVSVAPTPGGGATFTLTLPRAVVQARTAGASDATPSTG